MKRSIAVVCILSFAPFTAGCGVIFGGTRQAIHVASDPAGAGVATTPGTVEYKTPAVISLDRSSQTVLTFSAPGYGSRSVEIQRSIRGGIVVLDVLFGLVPLIVDAATGAWYKLEPANVNVTLVKVARIAGPETIEIALRVDEKTNVVQVESSVPGVAVRAE